MAKKQTWLEEHKKGCKCSICKEDAMGRVAYYYDNKPTCINCAAKIDAIATIEED